jgi:beta-barrel assembly-enhancing protease
MIPIKSLVIVIATTSFLGLPSAQTLPNTKVLNQKNLKTLEQKVEHAVATKSIPTLKPQEGLSLVTDLPDSDEQALGRETAGRLLAAYPIVKNDSIERYVNLVGSGVALQSKRSNLRWTFGVIESDDINAFAAPGGYVFVTSGLYKTLQNEAELAAVLGHEIAHVNLRHQVRLMQKERLIADGRNFLARQTKQEALKELAGSGAEISARTLDKDAEFEADRQGIEYVARAGYDPFAYLETLDRMGADSETDRLSLLLKTHPHPRDRIASLEKAIGARWNGIGGIVPSRWIALK